MTGMSGGRGSGCGMTLWLDEKTDELVIIDQTLLPNEERTEAISDARSLHDAIKQLKVRGAPAIGVAAAVGLYACAARFEDTSADGFMYSLKKTGQLIASARPTASNLAWAVERMLRTAETGERGVEAILDRLKKEAIAILEEDIDICRRIGEHGLTLLKDGATVLTHCNAGSLAAVKYGTALAPIYVGMEKGYSFKIYADETRPLLQGARLTAFELSKAGADVTLICDGAAAGLMRRGEIDAVIVGCDRVAANYDFANKIGTLPLAVCAARFGVPFYVAAPKPTFDLNTPTGDDIIIERRPDEEITHAFFSKPSAPEGVPALNPAFDVIPRSLVSAYITEEGVVEIGRK